MGRAWYRLVWAPRHVTEPLGGIHRLPAVRTTRLAHVTLLLTIFLIGFGGYTRGSQSGYGCEDRWPLCEDGLLGGWVPRWEFHMIIEWSHRWIAAWVGLLAVLLVVAAWRQIRRQPLPAVLSLLAVTTIGVQAWIGRAVVKNDLAMDLVTIHLLLSVTIALLVLGVAVASTPQQARPSDPAWRAAVAWMVGGTVVVLVLGSLVHNLAFAGWPFMEIGIIPAFTNPTVILHWSHRVAVLVVLIGLLVLRRRARVSQRPTRSRRVVGAATLLFAVNILLGWLHVITSVSSSWVVAFHLTLSVATTVLLAAELFRASQAPADAAESPTPVEG